MKRFFIYTLICSLTALMGCDKNDEVMNDLATTNGKKVTVTAHIQGDAATRVTLTPDTDESENPIVKVDWKASGETFKAYADGVAEPILFTQTEDTEDSKNLFEGTLPETPTEYTVYYSKKDYDLSAQDGTLNEAYVLMQATTDFSTTIDFEHKTAILKPTFKVGDAALAANTITQIVMGGINNPTSTTATGSIAIAPSALGDIYIFLPAFESYTAGHTFTFNVTASGQDYQATLTIPDSRSIEAGKFYTATIKLTIPYLTFTAQGAQTFKMNTEFEYTLPDTLQYSVGGNAWTQLNAGASINFGGANGNLRLRGKSRTGTAENVMNYSWIVFGNNTPVDCTGDIRTLVDWEKYNTVSTSDARFCRLFNGCSALTTAPALPATSLADHCYYDMFRGCTSLTAAPATLPADTLAEGCYQSMFYGCTSLETAPATLPATTLANYCYNQMFRGCTSLTTAPALPAIELADYCYQSMFRDCTSLATAPATLPATTLANYCYNFMFQGCRELTTAPALPATTLAVDCYSGMFIDCTKLTAAPTLSATTLAEGCYYTMFKNCTSLKTAPALQATTLAPSCYSYMFKNCTSLETAPATLPATTLALSCYYEMFYGCTSLTAAPATLPATTLAVSCYYGMFYGCTSLATAPDLPATTLTNNCYYRMFYGCTSLATAPALPATTLAKFCYYQMFYNCSKLNSITMLATDISASSCLQNWVSGVAATGTFTKAAAMTSLPNGASGIPEGWTAQDYSATPQ